MQSHLTQERRYASPSFRGQQGPDRRRQIAHRGIQANAPGQIALQTRFSVIRPASSIYERHRGWDIENVFDEMKHPMGLGRLHDARSCPLPARGPAACVVLQLVEHFRPSRRSQPPPRAITSRLLLFLGRRSPPSPGMHRGGNHDLYEVRTPKLNPPPGRLRPSPPSCEAWLKICSAVDPPAKIVSDPVARLPGVPQRPPPPGPASPRADPPKHSRAQAWSCYYPGGENLQHRR